MKEHDRILDAFRNCITEPKCKDCPWTECEELDNRKIKIPADLALSVMRELVAQEPRVMTLDEVEDALDTVVWVDRPFFTNSNDNYAVIISYSHKRNEITVKYFGGAHYATFSYPDYGKIYRFWNKRPTDEQREAAKWDV